MAKKIDPELKTVKRNKFDRPYDGLTHKSKRRVNPKRMIRAIKGSGGIKAEIAQRLNVSRNCISHIIFKRRGGKKIIGSDGVERPIWDEVFRVYTEECEEVADAAEKTVKHLITQRKDLPEAGKNSRWHLEKRRRDLYGDNKTVTIEGGKSPLQVEQRNVISGKVLEKLPIEVRKTLLKAIREAAEEESKGEEKE